MDTSGAGRSIQRPHQAHEWRPATNNLGSHFDDSRVLSILQAIEYKGIFIVLRTLTNGVRARVEQTIPFFSR
jgi:hypothetical protein